MTNTQLTDERLVKILSETQATIMEHNSRCVRGSVEVDARLFESMIIELQVSRKTALDSEPVAWLAIYHGEVYDEAIGITRSVVEAQADHFGWESALTEIIPLYSHAQQPTVAGALADAFIAAIEKEQDRLHEEDYLMDSKDCIDVIREEVQRLNANCITTLTVSPQEVK